MNMYTMPLIYNSINLHTFKNLPSNKCLGIALLACKSFKLCLKKV